MMRFVSRLSRILFSLTFILSGIFKLIDPVGTGLIVGEYLHFMHLDFISGAREWLGIALASAEFVIGIGVLIGLKLRYFSIGALGLISFFTLLTLYLAIYNPISDCGCFGEAIHLTNTQTFVKNVILLLLALLIFFGRKSSSDLGPDSLQYCFMLLSLGAALSLAIYSKVHIPVIDFTAYNVGTDLHDVGSEVGYQTSFIYEKDGEQRDFTLDNLPDSTWTFVDSKTEQLWGSTAMAQIDFQLHSLSDTLLVVSAYDPDKLSDKWWKAYKELEQRGFEAGLQVALYTPYGGDDCFASDRKSLLTLNRSNGGVTWISEGVIVQKWSSHRLKDIDVQQIRDKDVDIVILQHRIEEQVFSSIVVLGVLALLMIVKYLCKMIIKK